MRRAKPKKVAYQLIERNNVLDHAMYDLLDELVEEHHGDLRFAKIALAWCTSWKPDVDGVVVLGRCVKASDLDRELVPYDFVILLSKSFWYSPSVEELQRRALLDHELCHADVARDRFGEIKEDERGRRIYRTRKHDIEEFREIVHRYGCYKRDLELFATSIRKTVLETPHEACDTCRDSPGWVATEDKKVVRCACYLQWQQARQQATDQAVSA